MRAILLLVVLANCGPSDAQPDAGPPDAGPDAGLDGGGQPPCQFPSPFYADADGDGSGSKLDAVLYACALPPGYVGNQLDCADGDARARPGGGLQSTPIDGGTSSGLAWDFGCDGVEDPQFANVANCGGVGNCSNKDNGWRFGLAACGATEQWVTSCGGGTGACYVSGTQLRTQACQ